ncbi:hypothetical protein LTR66_001412 [Elasticomyces elasticus]|nr:hypothetical protein LTR66_001412 [Elasticomyces elasticus]
MQENEVDNDTSRVIASPYSKAFLQANKLDHRVVLKNPIAMAQAIEVIAAVVIGEVVSIVQGVINENKDKDVRSGWTQSTLGKVMDKFPGKNAIIVWTEHDASGLRGSQQGNLMCPCPNQNKTMTYKCYVFDSGDFHLKGDGGYLNWAFAGKYNRHGKDLSFTS